jgi:broad specificity phosphatase PhoE
VKHVRLIRHAESAANVGLATTSPSSIALTELGHRQALAIADIITSAPDLIVSSPFDRAIATAFPTTQRYPDVPFEIWPVEEFTYLSPNRFAESTQADRKPMADAYWRAGEKNAVDGSGAESFAELLGRAKDILDRLADCEVENILVFSHGQFIRAIAWFIKHGEQAGEAEFMRLFRELDTDKPLLNCAGYELAIRDGRWVVDHQVSQDGNVKFIDGFCTDQSDEFQPST